MTINSSRLKDDWRKSIVDLRKLTLDLRRLVLGLPDSVFAKEGESVVGLDINQKYITVVGLEEMNQATHLKYIASSPMPSGLIEQGVIINPKALGKEIRNLFDKQGIKSRRVVAAVGGRGVMIHISKVPSMSDSEMKQALKTEVSHYIIFAGSQIISDTYKLEEIAEEGIKKSRVILGVAKKEIIDSYVATIKEAGLDLLALDIDSLVITRTLYSHLLKLSLNQPIILIALQFENAGFSILKKGVLSYFHSAELGVKDMINREEFIGKLASELESVMTYYQAEYGQGVKKVVLAGEINKIEHLERDLSAKFAGLNVEKGNPLTDIVYDAEKLSQEKNKLPVFAYRAIGLAMRGIGRGEYPVKINLLPIEELKVGELKSQLKILGISLCAIVFLLFLSFIALKLWIGFTVARTVSLQEELSKPNPVLVKLLGVEKDAKVKLDEIGRQKQIIYQAQAKRWDEILEEIKSIIPKEVRLIRLTDRENQIVFRGEAASQRAVFNFVRTLRESPYFTEVKLHAAKDIEKRGRVYIDFDIRCRLDLPEDK